METCLDDSELLSYVQGALTSRERQRLDLHLGKCASCCELVAETAKLLEADSTAEGSRDSMRAAPPAQSVQSDVALPYASVGRYQLQSILGRGGTGVVYSARDPELHRQVAIKLLRGDVLDRDKGASRARLLREARAMARVSHPHVVAIYDVGVWSEQVFVAMELVEGRTLRSLFADRGVSWRTRLACLIEAGRGLCAAHAAGLVHRDFKPENVLVGSDGRVRVTDFGLAKPARGDPSKDEAAPARSKPLPEDLATVTLTGHTTGTPAYMAPEQFLDRDSDARADQFAFCVVVHEALYGVRPFAGKALADLARNVLESRVTDVSSTSSAEVPTGFHPVILRGLAREPDERYPTLEHLLDELEALRKANDAPRTPAHGITLPGAPAFAESTSSRRRGRAVLVSAATIVLCASLSIGWASRRRADLSPSATTSPQDARSSDAAALSSDAPSVANGTATRDTRSVAAASADREPAPNASSHAVSSAPRGRATSPAGRGSARATVPRSKTLGDRVENPF